ncbi:hypothetical protein SPI_02645 [Niveomyces insectorum RCEF 264]|uniref:DUF8021 domain-containing protein n=1 Tax=Niveomyces insectorum RCEF 264 TaxID=1081102 RepID=A0A162KC23_9HYPO|nr:hypothetical protein SPI_02645 [Niveomyces insectorum RCEF 264]
MIYSGVASFVVGALSLAAGTVAADCSRDTLVAAAETYIAAQSSGQLDDLQKLFDTTVGYQENNKKATITTGLLSKALKLNHNRTTADTTQCASYTELISTAGPYVIGTHITHTADGAKITLIDTIAATTGDWAFDAAKTLSYVSTEDWGPLDASQQSSRATLQAAADAYLDMWSNSTAINAVPWGTPCARTEGSAHVTPSCKSGAPSGGTAAGRNTDRRYVIDETVGSCSVACAFGGQMPDNHEFRLISGKLRLVHTITV